LKLLKSAVGGVSGEVGMHFTQRRYEIEAKTEDEAGWMGAPKRTQRHFDIEPLKVGVIESWKVRRRVRERSCFSFSSFPF
jgi:hypothetical protein